MVHAVGEVIVTTHLDIVRNKNLKEAGFYDDIAEHQCVVETMFQISRIIGYGSLVLAALFRNTIILQVLLVVFVVIFASSQIILLKYEKDETNEQMDRK